MQTFKGLTGGVMLRLERTQSNRQLVRVILVLTGILAHPVELLAQAVTPRQQQFALFGVGGHCIEGFLQLQARFAHLLVLKRALLSQLGQLFVQTTTAQGQLLDFGFARR